MNFHAKSGVCSSKNERVMALGTKEDGHFAEEVGKEEKLIIFKGLYSPNLEFVSSQVWTIFNCFVFYTFKLSFQYIQNLNQQFHPETNLQLINL